MTLDQAQASTVLKESRSLSVEEDVPFSVENYINELLEKLQLNPQSITCLNIRIVAHFMAEEFPPLKAKYDDLVAQLKEIMIYYEHKQNDAGDKVHIAMEAVAKEFLLTP